MPEWLYRIAEAAGIVLLILAGAVMAVMVADIIVQVVRYFKGRWMR